MQNQLRMFILATTMTAAGTAFAQNINPQLADPSFNSWMTTHKGNITKQEYMDEAGRRWDRMDNSGQGLTPAEIDSMYGRAPTPNMVKRSTNKTNPTGTESAGQNSGGK